MRVSKNVDDVGDEAQIFSEAAAEATYWVLTAEIPVVDITQIPTFGIDLLLAVKVDDFWLEYTLCYEDDEK